MSYDPINYSGGEGTAVLDGTDVNVEKWTGTVTFTNKNATTTGDWDPTDGTTYGRDKHTMRRFEATLDAFIDGNNFMLSGFMTNAEMDSVDLSMGGGHKVHMDKAIISSMPIDTGGTEGIQSFKLSIKSQGKFVIS